MDGPQRQGLEVFAVRGRPFISPPTVTRGGGSPHSAGFTIGRNAPPAGAASLPSHFGANAAAAGARGCGAATLGSHAGGTGRRLPASPPHTLPTVGPFSVQPFAAPPFAALPYGGNALPAHTHTSHTHTHTHASLNASSLAVPRSAADSRRASAEHRLAIEMHEAAAAA